MIAWGDILLRLGVATLASGVIGLNRDLHGKPIGLRTLGLVGLACAAVVVFAMPAYGEARISDATSRVIQGILTGIGFLGAGVIVHAEVAGQSKVHGLTSAACVWFTACIGVICGAGEWRLVAVALGIALVLLMAGGPLERTLRRLFSGDASA
ncbi:Protein MgtC OS=Afipia felis OX=1035 GN=BN961_01761 PE=3 SV=1 [Afipia felis]